MASSPNSRLSLNSNSPSRVSLLAKRVAPSPKRSLDVSRGLRERPLSWPGHEHLHLPDFLRRTRPDRRRLREGRPRTEASPLRAAQTKGPPANETLFWGGFASERRRRRRVTIEMSIGHQLDPVPTATECVSLGSSSSRLLMFCCAAVVRSTITPIKA